MFADFIYLAFFPNKDIRTALYRYLYHLYSKASNKNIPQSAQKYIMMIMDFKSARLLYDNAFSTTKHLAMETELTAVKNIRV